MDFNAELAWRAYRHIEKHPEMWNQDQWRCETGMCYAGHVAMLAGARWRHPYVYGESTHNAWVTTPEGEEAHVSDFAAEKLGLHPNAAWYLFENENTLEQIRHHIERLEGNDY